MEKTKMQKGITLIALIITIIVLLILAIVSINLVMNGGIITHTEDAVEKYEIEEEKEKVTLAVREAYMSGLGTITEENLASALDKNIGAGKYSIASPNSEYFKVTITESGREYKVYPNGKVEATLENSGEEEGENPPQQTEMPVAAVGIKVETNSTINGEKYSSTNPIIPAGFTAINVTIEGQESSWDAEGGPEVDKGLIIRDDSGNEFVWVPVPDDISTTEYISRTDYKEPVTIGEIQTDSYGNITGYTFDAIEENLERANCEDIDLDGTLELSDFEAELTSMYAKMAESVNKYDGFYVGRFETSRNGTSPQSKRSSGTIYDETFIKTAYNSSTENDWYGLYALNKRYSTGSVQGSMIWGIQYDAMVTWMRDAKKSTISDFNRGGTCGTTPDDVLKNVYDIYGNCYEWTLEGNTLNEARVFCGIQVDQKDLYLGIRGMTDPMSVSEQSYYGSRLALYVM